MPPSRMISHASIFSLSLQALKDSLGGNCRTTMVATISSEQQQVDESISTCRFAERVAMVRNMVSKRKGGGSACDLHLPFNSLYAYPVMLFTLPSL